MENREIQRIITLFKETFNGPTWHGPALKEVLIDVLADQALRSINNGHNIAELISHMIAWRVFLVNKLKGDDNYDVSDEENFVTIENLDESEWQALQNQLNESQEELLTLLTNKEDVLLEKKVGLRNYNYYILIHGIIQHDLYHLGQIVMIKKYA